MAAKALHCRTAHLFWIRGVGHEFCTSDFLSKKSPEELLRNSSFHSVGFQLAVKVTERHNGCTLERGYVNPWGHVKALQGVHEICTKYISNYHPLKKTFKNRI